ncbi:MAG: hypothetical protein C0P72_008115, partial [Clostridia bacterium]
SGYAAAHNPRTDNSYIKHLKAFPPLNEKSHINQAANSLTNMALTRLQPVFIMMEIQPSRLKRPLKPNT